MMRLVVMHPLCAEDGGGFALSKAPALLAGGDGAFSFF